MGIRYRAPMVLLVISAILVVSQLYCLLPVAQNLQFELGVPLSDIALLTTFFGFAYACGFLFWGPISDKYGRKPILVGGMLLLSLTSFALSLMKGYDASLYVRIVQGFVAASFPPVALAWIAENIHIKKRMASIAYMSSAFLLAALVGQLLGDWLIERSLDRYMQMSAVLYLICALGLAGLPGASYKRPVSLVSIWSKIPATLMHPALSKAYIATPLVLCSFVSLYTFFVSHFGPVLNNIGLSVTELRWFAAPFMLIPLVVSKLIIKIGPKKTVAVSLLVASAALGGQVWSLDHSNIIFVPAHFIFVAAIATIVPSLIAYISGLASDEVRGLAIALYTFLLFVGASSGAWIASNFESSTLYMIAFLLSLGALINLPWSSLKPTAGAAE